MYRTAVYGIVLWAIGTAVIRLSGPWILSVGALGRTTVLYTASFLLMAWVTPRICAGLGFDRRRWFEATAVLILPTLVLDPWACVFFGQVYPNLNPEAAGLFGGWMLMFCAGAVTGVLWKRGR